jgi:short-subunit dehydrogenase
MKSQAMETIRGKRALVTGVTAFCPCLVDTPMMDRSGPGWLRKAVSLGPLSLIMSPDAVARRAISSIRSDRGLVSCPGVAN